ncbi:hypothetical protein HYX14_03950 [Candidatus Woesearchaeota archaeon]|nr:hypothetical protein [Candidatus Woesearchaeota archaeon]
MDEIRDIQEIVQKLTGHSFTEIVTRGNAAIEAAFSVVKKKLLIPAEGGWIHYQKAPKKLGLKVEEVKGDLAKINLVDLERKLKSGEFDALLYQNPGGYFAEQPMKEIYELCKKHNCLVIMDVSGAIGTRLCDGGYADIFVGSFGEWKLVEAKVGGFISAKEETIWKQLVPHLHVLRDVNSLEKIREKLQELPQRIKELTTLRNKVVDDLQKLKLTPLHPHDIGFVVVVLFLSEPEKENNKITSHFELSPRERIINYCRIHSLPFTECPRYIRVLEKAISIEIKKKKREE